MLYGVVENKRQTNLYQGHGISGAGNVKIDWPAMMAFKRGYTDQIPAGTESGLAASGIDHVHGAASFIDQHTILVDQAHYTATNIVIATGAKANVPDISGAELLETSTDFLALDHLPKEIGFIGAGYVAIELANIAVEAGAVVHIFQHNNRILRGFPKEYSEKLVQLMQEKGVIFHWNVNVTSLDKPASQIKVLTNHDDQVTLDRLFVAAGRDANITNLNLSVANIDSNHGGIIVNDHLQTTASNVYALGDAISKSVPKLTPVASYEGRYVASQIEQIDNAPLSYPVIPHTVFAGPELSQVGISLDEAQKAPDKYQIKAQKVGAWYTYHRVLDDSAMVTTIIDQKTGFVVGAVVLATNAEELINYFTDLINNHKTLATLSNQIPVYPSAASDLTYFL